MVCTQLISEFPEERQKVEDAIIAVDGNKYYGYRKDSGPARFTKFKSIAYVAKELYIKVGGKDSLRMYGGWANRIAFKAEI